MVVCLILVPGELRGARGIGGRCRVTDRSGPAVTSATSDWTRADAAKPAHGQGVTPIVQAGRTFASDIPQQVCGR